MKLIILLITLTTLSFISCNSNPIDAEENLPPGRRDYVWTVDTLNIPFTRLQRIWGSSPEDVWAIGPGGASDKTIYHFDGEKWTNDGIARPLDPTAIFGFSNDNVWIGSFGGDIWRFNGSNWRHYTSITNETEHIVWLDIWGENSNDVFATGCYPDENGNFINGIMAHYNGSSWSIINLAETKSSLVKIRKDNKASSKYYLIGYRIEPFAEDTSKIYEFGGNSLNTIYTGLTTSQELAEAEIINGKLYFIKGYEICEYVNNEFRLFLYVDNINFGNAISGRNKKDIFLRMKNGIAHYNGTNIEYLHIFNKSGISILGSVIFEEKIFFLAYDYNNSLNLILRGILNE